MDGGPHLDLIKADVVLRARRQQAGAFVSSSSVFFGGLVQAADAAVYQE